MLLPWEKLGSRGRWRWRDAGGVVVERGLDVLQVGYFSFDGGAVSGRDGRCNCRSRCCDCVADAGGKSGYFCFQVVNSCHKLFVSFVLVVENLVEFLFDAAKD